MSTIRVSGDSSGYYDLTVPSVAGTNTIDLSKVIKKDSSGVVEIGTDTGTQPSYFNSYLNVQNNASTSDHASITITAGTGGYAGLHFGDSDNGRIGQIAYSNTDDALVFTSGNSSRMTLNSSGVLTKPYQPAWSVYNTTSGYISTTAQTTNTLVWNAEDFDVGGNFANNKFTCPVAGIYWAEVHIHHANTTGQISLTLWRERSGSSTLVSYHNRSGSNIIERGIRTSQLIQCQAGDKIWSGLWHENTNSSIYFSTNASTYTGFQGYLLG